MVHDMSDNSNKDIMNLINFDVKYKMEQDEMHSFFLAHINARNASGNLKMAIGTAWIQRN